MEEVNFKKIQVMKNAIITTANKIFSDEEWEKIKNRVSLEKDEYTGILFKNTAQAKNLPELIQQVVNVGPFVHDIQVGDWVYLNPLYYLNRKLVEQRGSIQNDVKNVTGTTIKEEYSDLDYVFPTITLDGVPHLLLFDRDVEYVILEATKGDLTYKSRE